MLNILVLRDGAMPDSMSARELLANIKERSAINSCEKWCLSPSGLFRKCEKRLQEAWMQFSFSPMRWLKNTRDHMKL
jgi:hypothetical protein